LGNKKGSNTKGPRAAKWKNAEKKELGRAEKVGKTQGKEKTKITPDRFTAR